MGMIVNEISFQQMESRANMRDKHVWFIAAVATFSKQLACQWISRAWEEKESCIDSWLNVDGAGGRCMMHNNKRNWFSSCL